MADSAQSFGVVLFTGGPTIAEDVVDFAVRLELDTDIKLLAIFSESPVRGLAGTVSDLWRRRGLLAVPLFMLAVINPLARAIRSPTAVSRRRRMFRRIRRRLRFVEDVHDPEVIAELRKLEPALGLIYGGPILESAVFEVPRLGTLGIHHGKVPDYRGKKTTFWAMYNGEAEVGVTIQRIGARLDGGDVLRDGCVSVGKRWPASVKRRLTALGLDLYVDAVHAVRTGTAVYRAQAKQPSPLYRDPGPGDILRFWYRYLMRLLTSGNKSPERRA